MKQKVIYLVKIVDELETTDFDEDVHKTPKDMVEYVARNLSEDYGSLLELLEDAESYEVTGEIES